MCNPRLLNQVRGDSYPGEILDEDSLAVWFNHADPDSLSNEDWENLVESLLSDWASAGVIERLGGDLFKLL